MVGMGEMGDQLIWTEWQSIQIVGASACVVFILLLKIKKMAKCTFWYWLTRVVPDKVQRAVKWLCMCVCVISPIRSLHAYVKADHKACRDWEVIFNCCRICKLVWYVWYLHVVAYHLQHLLLCCIDWNNGTGKWCGCSWTRTHQERTNWGVFFTSLDKIYFVLVVPSVLWHCWLGVMKSIRPVKNWVMGAGMVICLECGSNDLYMVQLMTGMQARKGKGMEKKLGEWAQVPLPKSKFLATSSLTRHCSTNPDSWQWNQNKYQLVVRCRRCVMFCCAQF